MPSEEKGSSKTYGTYRNFPKTSKLFSKIYYDAEKKIILEKSPQKLTKCVGDQKTISVYEFILKLLHDGIKFDLASYLIDCVSVDYINDDELLDILETDQSRSLSLLEINQLSTNNTTLIQFACQHGFSQSVEYLLKLKAKLGTPAYGLLTQHLTFVDYICDPKHKKPLVKKFEMMRSYLKYVLDNQEEIKEFLTTEDTFQHLHDLVEIKKTLKKLSGEIDTLAKEDPLDMTQ